MTRSPLLMGLLLCLAAACKPERTEVRAMEPFVDRYDREGGPGLDAVDWARLGDGVTAFVAVDSDGDGRLNGEELLAHVRGQDPLRFDGAGTRALPEDINPPFFPASFRVRRVREVMRFLVSEVRHRDPSAKLPSTAFIEAAAATGDLQSAKSQRVMRFISRAAAEAGMTLPDGISPGEVGP